MLPERITRLDVSIAGDHDAGQLLKASNFEFRHVDAAPDQSEVALLMPASRSLTWNDAALFPPMDQNLPEGDLFMRIRALFPKQQTTAMHLRRSSARTASAGSAIGCLAWRRAVRPRRSARKRC